MKFSSLCVLVLSLRSAVSEEASCLNRFTDAVEPSFVEPKYVMKGIVHTDIDKDIVVSDVFGCCSGSETTTATCDPNQPTDSLEPKLIGSIPQMNKEQTLQVLEDAKAGWNGGFGAWPQLSLSKRITLIQTLMAELKQKREEIVITLMWEIGKNRKDAEAEFDRTMAFVDKVIETIQTDDSFSGGWTSVGSTHAFVRMAAVGIVLCLGPYNYPLNETYATLIPALLMGNIVIMKVPTVGGLSHLLTMEAFSKVLPPGTMNFVSGKGRETMPTLMETGDIDSLAFIGGSNAADQLIQQHPKPHRLKVFLQLEAKNMAVFLPSIFQSGKDSELESALDQSILGSLSYNGQRCTALKLFLIPKGHGESFAAKLASRVENLSVGLPWESWASKEGSTSYSQVTPLPNLKRIEYMKSLIEDAINKGAKVLNKDGGKIIGGEKSTLMVPAVIYPVSKNMKLYYEEQFGPVIPVSEYDDIETVLEYGRTGEYGQQISLFTSIEDAATTAMLLDKFSSIFGKININSQCGRSPDTLPFSGRRSSAMGVMSVADALKEFSIPTVVAYKDGGINEDIAKSAESKSAFMQDV